MVCIINKYVASTFHDRILFYILDSGRYTWCIYFSLHLLLDLLLFLCLTFSIYSHFSFANLKVSYILPCHLWLILFSWSKWLENDVYYSVKKKKDSLFLSENKTKHYFSTFLHSSKLRFKKSTSILFPSFLSSPKEMLKSFYCLPSNHFSWAWQVKCSIYELSKD